MTDRVRNTLILGEVFQNIAKTAVSFDDHGRRIMKPDSFREIYAKLVAHSFISITNQSFHQNFENYLAIFYEYLLTSEVLNLKENVADLAKLEVHKAKRTEEIVLIFEAAYVILLYTIILNELRHNPVDFYPNVESFLFAYREVDIDWESADECEKKKLFLFANFMKVTLLAVPKPNGQRGHLVDIITRIVEGKGKKYVTGSGQSIYTTRRVKIYEHESGVQPTPRPPRASELLQSSVNPEEIQESLMEASRKKNKNNNRRDNSYPAEKRNRTVTYSTSHPSNSSLKLRVTAAGDFQAVVVMKPSSSSSSGYEEAGRMIAESHIDSEDNGQSSFFDSEGVCYVDDGGDGAFRYLIESDSLAAEEQQSLLDGITASAQALERVHPFDGLQNVCITRSLSLSFQEVLEELMMPPSQEEWDRLLYFHENENEVAYFIH